MLRKIKLRIKSNKFLSFWIVSSYRRLKFVLSIPKQIKLYRQTKEVLCAARMRKRVYYIGIPAHTNLGDLAQGVCIRNWLKKHYPDREVVEVETNALVNTCFSVKKYLKKAFQKDDIIVFQSGYTTTDLGGYADEMHCAVIRLLPMANILMMPQTIFFKREERKQNTSTVYNSARNMMFLARDRVSFKMAKAMFPDISVCLYPDIVTTLIGKFAFYNDREGILFCCRDDEEKYYLDSEINWLIKKCEEFTKVEKTDTTKMVKHEDIVHQAEKYIMSEIERYSRYKVIITDRYHGTIFSLIAGTPVIIIKTTDHKVTTGAEWFKGIYDDYVYLADTLKDAYALAQNIVSQEITHKLEPFFEEEYYDKLPEKFCRTILEKRY